MRFNEEESLVASMSLMGSYVNQVCYDLIDFMFDQVVRGQNFQEVNFNLC